MTGARAPYPCFGYLWATSNQAHSAKHRSNCAESSRVEMRPKMSHQRMSNGKRFRPSPFDLAEQPNLDPAVGSADHGQDGNRKDALLRVVPDPGTTGISTSVSETRWRPRLRRGTNRSALPETPPPRHPDLVHPALPTASRPSTQSPAPPSAWPRPSVARTPLFPSRLGLGAIACRGRGTLSRIPTRGSMHIPLPRM